MKYNSIINCLSSGEMSRYAKGRTDLEDYYKAAEEITNFIPLKHGGAYFRPGTILSPYYWNNTSIEKYIMVPFTPRDGESYIIALNPSKGSEQIGITRIGTGYLGVSIQKSSYIWNTRTDFTDVTGAYDPTTNTKHQDLMYGLNWTQSGDVVIVFDGTGKLAPIAILRTAENTFVIDSVIKPIIQIGTNQPLYLNTPALHLRVPFKDPNTDTNIRLKVSSVTAGTTVTMTAEDASANPVSLFKGDVVGMWVKLTHISTSATGVGLIVSKNSDTSVQVAVTVAFGGTGTSTFFELSMWTPSFGYPRCGTFFEQRLVCGGSPTFPDTIWFSMTGNIYLFMQRKLVQDATNDTSGYNFYGPAKVTDPFNFIPAASSSNSIQWLHSADSLIVGTTKNEYSISGGIDNPLSLSYIFVKNISSYGSSRVQPIKAGSSIIFVSKDGRRVYEIPKNLQQYDSALELSSLSEGIIDKAMDLNGGAYRTESKVRRLVWHDSENILWVFCDDPQTPRSSVLTFTYDKTSKTVAWAKQNFGNARFYSLCALPDSTKGDSTRMYFWLRRSGATFCSLEVLSSKNLEDKLILHSDTLLGANSTFMDATTYQANAAGNTTIGINSLVLQVCPGGSTYRVFAEVSGVVTYLGEFVDGANGFAGQLTIPALSTYPSCNLIIGLKYVGKIKTMPLEAGAQFGVAQGSLRRTHEISLFVDRSLKGSYSASKSNNQYDLVQDNLGAGISNLYTGEVRLSNDGSPDDSQIIIVQDQPFPLVVLWILQKGYTYDA